MLHRAGSHAHLWPGVPLAVASALLFGISAPLAKLLLGSVAWGIDNNPTRKLSAADPVLIALIKGLLAGSVNLALALLRGASLPPKGIVTSAAMIGLLGVGVSLVLFVLALRHLGSARTGAYFSLAPFIWALVAVVLLHEPVTVQLAAAALLMGFGLWLHLTERHDHEHEHEAMEHEHRHVHDEHHQHAHAGHVTKPHSHRHRHEPLRHKHLHYPIVGTIKADGLGQASLAAVRVSSAKLGSGPTCLALTEGQGGRKRHP